MRWLENSAHWIGNLTLGNVQFGWEITSASGGPNFQTNSYWVSYNRSTRPSTCDGQAARKWPAS